MAIPKDKIIWEGLTWALDWRDRFAAKLAHEGSEDTVTFNHPITTDGRPIFGSYHGFGVSDVEITGGVCDLANKVINNVSFTGISKVTARLPDATVGSSLVFLFGRGISWDKGGDVQNLTIVSYGNSQTDIFEAGCQVPSTANHKYEFVSSNSWAGSEVNQLVFTPSLTKTNFFAVGSTIEFICVNAGKWFVHVNPKHDMDVSYSACVGTLEWSGSL